jgi:c-di-GMP-binding flagellar brake protein YcgR
MPKLEDILSINDNVELEVLNGPLSGKAFITRVEDMTKNSIMLAAPFDPERVFYIHIRTGTRVRISFPKKDAIYQFNSSVADSRSDRIPIIIVNKPKEIFRFQRREFVRLDDIIPVSYKVTVPEKMDVKYKLIDKKELPGFKPGQIDDSFLNGFTKNISGNGMLIVVKKDIAKLGNLLEISFRLPGRTKIFDVIGEIVRIAVEIKVEGNDEIGVGVRFVKIDERDRTEIIRYIFDKQREIIKKGLLQAQRKGG